LFEFFSGWVRPGFDRRTAIALTGGAARNFVGDSKAQYPMKKIAPLVFTILALAVVVRSADSPAAAEKKISVALMPISKGNAYFISCRDGAETAAKELGINLIFDGPADPDPAQQNAIVDKWIAQGVDAIAAACENKDGMSDVLRKARSKGIKVITYDADAQASARAFFVNQATSESIGIALMDDAAQLCGNQGEYAVIAANLTSANEIAWRKYIDARNQTSYPGMKQVAIRSCDDMMDKAQVEAAALLKAYPNLKLIMAICSPGVPGAAEAIKQAGKAGKVKLIGLGLPNENKRYVHEGVTDNVILWSTQNLGALTIHAAVALVKGTLKPGDKSFRAGSLGTFQVQGDEIYLGKPLIFNKDNIDQYNF
jgi:ABC-type sugar transport system substrate-binding protein